jgi:hypothetical protein
MHSYQTPPTMNLGELLIGNRQICFCDPRHRVGDPAAPGSGKVTQRLAPAPWKPTWENVGSVIDSPTPGALNGKVAIGSAPSYGSRRKDLAYCRRYSVLRARRAGVVAAREKFPDYILCQSGFWLDDCRLGGCHDVGNGRAE